MLNRPLLVCGSQRANRNFIHVINATKSHKQRGSEASELESPYAALPEELRSTKNFLLYKLQAPRGRLRKRSKVPVSPSTGLPLTNWQNPDNWMSFSEAHALFLRRPDLFDGLGYAMSGNRLICVDIDDARDRSGAYTPLAQELLRVIPGWAEVSTSGNLHIWTRGELSQGKSVNSELGLEIFYSSGFVALTGKAYEENRTIPAVDIDPNILAPYFSQKPAQRQLDLFEQYCRRDPNLTLAEARRILLEELQPTPRREDWLRVGMALHFEFQGAPEALEIWDEFSAREGCGDYLGFEDVRDQWESLRADHPNPITFASLRESLKKQVTKESTLRENPFVTLNLEGHHAINYLLNGIVDQGITLFNGASNAGKTTLIVDLVSVVAHLCPEDHFLRVKGRRKVIYLTEDVGQIERIFRGKRTFGGMTVSPEEINEWIKVISGKKFGDQELIHLVTALAEQESVTVMTKKGLCRLPPLFVIDTASANLKIEDENKNSEVSDYIAALKAAIAVSGASVWIVAHTPKASANVDVTELTARGAGAWGDNVQTVAGIQRDIGSNQTILAVRKNRVTTVFNELEFTTRLRSLQVEDDYGDEQTITYVLGDLRKSNTAERLARKKKEKQQRADAAKDERGQEMADKVMAHVRDFPYQNAGTLSVLGGNNAERERVIKRLIADGYLANTPATAEEHKASGKKVLLKLTEKKYPARDFEV